MSTSLETVTELLAAHLVELEKDRERLRRELRGVEGELTRVQAAIKSLRGKSERPTTATLPSKLRGGSVKAIVLEALQSSPELTPLDLTQKLINAGKLSAGKEGSVRTALWQLRKDGVIVTDADGRSTLAAST
jgi:chromosome segregation ATPase